MPISYSDSLRNPTTQRSAFTGAPFLLFLMCVAISSNFVFYVFAAIFGVKKPCQRQYYFVKYIFFSLSMRPYFLTFLAPQVLQ